MHVRAAIGYGMSFARLKIAGLKFNGVTCLPLWLFIAFPYVSISDILAFHFHLRLKHSLICHGGL